jgi:hypothetical protein
MHKFLFRTKIQRKKQTALSNFALTTSLICFLFSTVSVAQIMPQEEPLSDSEKQEIELKGKKERPQWLEKVHYGGNVWGGFFGSLYVDIAPMVGYEITEAGMIAGLGATFVYQGGEDNQFAVGPRLFVRQPIWRSFFAHAEYEFVNADESQFYSYLKPINSSQAPPPTEFKRKWEGSPIIGLGMYQGRNREQGGSFISVMYNLGYPNRGYISPQGIGGNDSPFVLRIGFFL